MDGNAITTKLIALDIEDAAYRLWVEQYEALISSGDEWGYGPSLERAWDAYVERGAWNYAWWDANDELNAAGRVAHAHFARDFEGAAEVHGLLRAG